MYGVFNFHNFVSWPDDGWLSWNRQPDYVLQANVLAVTVRLMSNTHFCIHIPTGMSSIKVIQLFFISVEETWTEEANVPGNDAGVLHLEEPECSTEIWTRSDISGLLCSLSILASLCVKPDLPRECLDGVGWMDQPRPQKALQQTSTDSHQPQSTHAHTHTQYTHREKITSRSFSEFHFFFYFIENVLY
jgi:hypothetical protein